MVICLNLNFPSKILDLPLMAACTVIVCKNRERGREGERRSDKRMRVGMPPLTVCVCVGGSGEETELLICPWFLRKRWTLLVQGGRAYWAN